MHIFNLFIILILIKLNIILVGTEKKQRDLIIILLEILY